MQKSMEQAMWKQIEGRLDEMIAYQQQNLLSNGRQLIPNLTHDDILQPNDFIELELNPHFRYEEGFLVGLQSARMALSALKKEMT